MAERIALIHFKLRAIRDDVVLSRMSPEHVQAITPVMPYLILSTEPQAVKELIGRMTGYAMSEKTAYKRLRSLEKAGYIHIFDCDNDRRVKRVAPTKKLWSIVQETAAEAHRILERDGIDVTYSGNIPCFFATDNL